MSSRQRAEEQPGKSTICDWYSNFKRGRTSTEDSKRSGRPKEVIIPEIIRQVRQIVLTDRRVEVREIAETVGISTGSAVSILHDHLHMKKLNVIEQREKRVADSKSCLDMFNRNPSEFLRRYITMGETWIHHYIPESNRSSAEWREAGESRSKRVKASRWAGSTQQSLLWQDIKRSLLPQDQLSSPCFGRTFSDPCCRRINSAVLALAGLSAILAAAGSTQQSLLWQDIQRSLLPQDQLSSPCFGRTFSDPCCRRINSAVLALAGHPAILAAAGLTQQSLLWQDIQRSLLPQD
ncbi:hypothetical protein ACLKA6_004573 [Drosophila palustris]